MNAKVSQCSSYSRAVSDVWSAVKSSSTARPCTHLSRSSYKSPSSNYKGCRYRTPKTCGRTSTTFRYDVRSRDETVNRALSYHGEGRTKEETFTYGMEVPSDPARFLEPCVVHEIIFHSRLKKETGECYLHLP